MGTVVLRLYLETSDEWSKLDPASGRQGSGKGTRQPQPLRRRCAATTRCVSGCRCPTGHRRRMLSRSGRAREAQQRAVLRAAWPQCRARTLLTLFHSICQDLRVTPRPLFNVPPHESHGRMCCAARCAQCGAVAVRRCRFCRAVAYCSAACAAAHAPSHRRTHELRGVLLPAARGEGLFECDSHYRPLRDFAQAQA